METLFRILSGIVSRGEKVLVFFSRCKTGELLSALAQKTFGTRPGMLRGDTSPQERESALAEFKKGPIPGEPYAQVLLLSVWLGALGLNLPEARWVVHVERVWNPQRERQ